MPNSPKLNNPSPRKQEAPVLAQMRKRVAVQASLALVTIVLTVVILFGMSAAWYTNIVHTSGLTFEVEAWGFNGEITSENVPIIAGPGDNGLVSLEVASESDSPSAVSVSFSKMKMPGEMQRRIYFYVDTQMTRNGESMDRVYLNSRETYTYTLFSQGKLTLTETVHNDAQLKWQWVYDVLGYYVQGNLLADGQDISVTEYLRPIEYDYDSATMEYVSTELEDGTTQLTMELKTVDGTMTLEEYLVELSKTDGYEGTIDPTKKLPSGYYPVDVDANGNGVYAYLCSYAEIQQETQYDTKLGQDALAGNQEQYEAKLLVSAQKSKNNVIHVTSLNGLLTAIGADNVDVIELSSDITIGAGETLTVAADQEVMLDLGGNRIICTDSAVPVLVEEGGSLTMINGDLVYENENEKSSYAFELVGAELVLSDVDLTGFERGMRINDNNGETAQDSAVRLVGCEWSTDSYTFLIYGNGSDSAQKTQVIIEDSVLQSNSITISGNGTVGNGSAENGGNYGTDIQILNSTVISNSGAVASAIYQPQKDSVLTIYNSTVSGYTGIAVKGGTVNVVGSVIKGEGAGMDEVTEFGKSGFNDTGDAIYIETNYGYDIELNISDAEITQADGSVITKTSVLTSTSQYGLRVYEASALHVKIRIYSGEFNRVADAETFLSYVDTGSEASNESGSYIVTVKPQTEEASEDAQDANG